MIFVLAILAILGACIYGAILGMGDANRATQHLRDREIINELKKMNNKDE